MLVLELWHEIVKPRLEIPLSILWDYHGEVRQWESYSSAICLESIISSPQLEPGKRRIFWQTFKGHDSD